MKISDYSSEEIAARLSLSIMNFEKNKDYLDNFPYIKKGEFAFVAQFCVGDQTVYGLYPSCLTVTNEILDKWGYSKDVLFSLAGDNAAKLFPSKIEKIDDYQYTITNSMGFNGAAALFYDTDSVIEQLQQICDGLADYDESSHLVVYPMSSNSLCVSIPKRNDELQYTDLAQINQQIVEAGENFGDEIYSLGQQVLGLDLQNETLKTAENQVFPAALLDENTYMKERSK